MSEKASYAIAFPEDIRNCKWRVWENVRGGRVPKLSGVINVSEEASPEIDIR